MKLVYNHHNKPTSDLFTYVIYLFEQSSETKVAVISQFVITTPYIETRQVLVLTCAPSSQVFGGNRLRQTYERGRQVASNWFSGATMLTGLVWSPDIFVYISLDRTHHHRHHQHYSR